MGKFDGLHPHVYERELFVCDACDGVSLNGGCASGACVELPSGMRAVVFGVTELSQSQAG
ncbi:MAG: hypothetical protein IPG50_12640 [Myxococcales bacterium]|nr:hypothetical protein [Myxococcales bacterium]